MKGLILAGGEGTRLRPLTYTSAKQLIPVANKPVLFYGIEHLVGAGVKEIGIVVGETAAEIEAAVGDGSPWGAEVTYIKQETPLGLAHAVKIARDFLGDEPFIMYLGDNVLRSGVSEFVDEFTDNGLNAQILTARVPDPERFGVVELDGERVVRVVEKPKVPPSDQALVGVYLFDKNVFEAIDNIEPSPRGELEITDAIQYLIDHDFKVGQHAVRGWWKDTGKIGDLLEANRIILGGLERRLDGEIDEDSEIFGNVVVEAGAKIVRSTIRGPAIVGADCVVEDAYVGPYTSLAEGAQIKAAEVEHCIILAGATIENLTRQVDASVIGRNARVYGATRKPRAHKLMIGDQSTVGIIE